MTSRFQRYSVLMAAVVIQTCLGATYAWSVFVQPLRMITGLGQGATQLPFSVLYIVFPATMVFSGALLSRLGPRRSAILGGSLFATGWLLAGLGGYHFFFTVAGIGVLSGLGIGIAYIVPIAVCVQWFPRHKGLVTGIAVAGFGGGAALIAQAAGSLIQAHGFTAFEVFRILGIVFLVLTTAGGAFMRRCPTFAAATGSSESAPSLLPPRAFWILYAAMFAGLAAGFTVNANLRELGSARALQAGTLAVSLFALANAGGRIVWGLAFDRSRTTVVLKANLLLQAIALTGGLWGLHLHHGLETFAFLAGFNYGGVLVLYAASVARYWGPERVGKVYGRLFSANIPASLAPTLAGMTYDGLGSFTVPLAILAITLIAAMLLIHKELHLSGSCTNE